MSNTTTTTTTLPSRKCGVMDIHNDCVQNETGYATRRRYGEMRAAATRRTARIVDVVKIPVVVHVVYHRDEANVSDEHIKGQIASLTEDFRAVNADRENVPEPFRELVAETKIEFALATRSPSGEATNGIIRRWTPVRRFPEATVPSGASTSPFIDREVKLVDKGSEAWPSDSYLNLWVCDMGRDPLGYAAFPGSPGWRDGVVIDYRCFGHGAPAVAPFDKGRTLTHEVGHWLDLLHIWGDDGRSCVRSDNVADTPNQAGSNGGEPPFPSVSCGNGPHGDLFVNYMDYVDDRVMVMFTKGQVERMHAALTTQRASILSSEGLDPPDAPVEPLETEDEVEDIEEEEADVRRARPRMRLARVAAKAAAPNEAPREMVFDGVSWVEV